MNHKCYLVTSENLNDKKKYCIFLEIFFILKIDQLMAFSHIKKTKRPDNTENKDFKVHLNWLTDFQN